MRSPALICTALIIMILAVYMDVANHPFLYFDDYAYVTNNPHVKSGVTGRNIIWAFTAVDAANWHPLTWLSHMTDAQFYGMNPRGHHLSSVLIHTSSSLLLLLFLLRYTGQLWQSTFVAALFALHPLRVESVAWVAERKDVLSTFFWILTLFLYSEYAIKRKDTFYFFAIFSFILGLMSKPMLVTLPAILLLIDFWPLNRFRKGEHELWKFQPANIKEKVPFLICALLSSIITVYAQNKGGAIKELAQIPFGYRIENAAIAYVNYIIKTLWPHDLAIIYPISLQFSFWQVIGSLAILILVTFTVVRVRHNHPYLTVGWLWFLVTMVPVIGLVQVGEQSMADRYTYVPTIGLLVMVAWWLPTIIADWKQKNVILTIFAGSAITILALCTKHQIRYWQDDITLFRHAIAVTTGNYVAHQNVAFALSKKGDIDGAIQEYKKVLSIKPSGYEARHNLAVLYTKKGDVDAAIGEYRIAVSLQPNLSQARNNLGFALASRGDIDLAIIEFREALRLEPDNADAHRNMGFALINKGNIDAAIKEFQTVLRITPNDDEARRNLEIALAQKKIQK